MRRLFCFDLLSCLFAWDIPGYFWYVSIFNVQIGTSEGAERSLFKICFKEDFKYVDLLFIRIVLQQIKHTEVS